jgi:hypothetical protein
MKVRIVKQWSSPKGNLYKVGSTANVDEFDPTYHQSLTGAEVEEAPKKKKKTNN